MATAVQILDWARQLKSIGTVPAEVCGDYLLDHAPVKVADQLPFDSNPTKDGDSGIYMVWRKPREGYDNHWQTVFYNHDEHEVISEEWFCKIEDCEFWMRMPDDPE